MDDVKRQMNEAQDETEEGVSRAGGRGEAG